MTFNSQTMIDLLPITAQFAQVPIEKWGDTVESHTQTILKVGDALVSAWENQTLAESDTPTARQFLYDCSYYLVFRPEHHRSNWLEMGVALAQADDETRAWFLSCLGGLQIEWGEYRKALGYYEQALTLYQAQHHLAHEGRVLSSMGGAWLMLDEPQKALSLQYEAQKLLEQADNKAYMPYVLNGLASTLMVLQKFDDLPQLTQQALAISREIGDVESEAVSLNNVGVIQKDDHVGVKYVQQALMLYRQVGHTASEAMIINNMAGYFSKRALPLKGIPYAEESLKIAQLLKNKHGQVMALNLLGVFQRQLGKQDKAQTYHNHALALAMQADNKLDEINTFTAIADMYKRSNEPQKWLEFMEKAVMIAQQTDAYPQFAFNIITHIASYYVKIRRDLPKALAISERLITITEKMGEADAMPMPYIWLTFTLSRMGRDKLDEAILAAEKGRDLFIQHDLTRDRGGNDLAFYEKIVKRLYKRRDGWFYKTFLFWR